MRAMAINGGVQLFQDKDFVNAYLAFTSSVEAYDVLGKQDTVAMYYAGLSADNLDEYDNALKYYGMAAALKYGGDSRTHQLMVKVATRKNGGNPSEETFKIIQEGRALYAGDLNLILEEFNYYYKTGDAVKAQNSLQEAVKADPENPFYTLILVLHLMRCQQLLTKKGSMKTQHNSCQNLQMLIKKQ